MAGLCYCPFRRYSHIELDTERQSNYSGLLFNWINIFYKVQASHNVNLEPISLSFCAAISVKCPSRPGQSWRMCREIFKYIPMYVYFYFFLRFFSFWREFSPTDMKTCVKEWKVNVLVELKCFVFSVTLLIMVGWMFSVESADFIYSRGLLNT